MFEEEPFLLLAGIKCTSPWPVTMVNTILNMVRLQGSLENECRPHCFEFLAT